MTRNCVAIYDNQAALVPAHDAGVDHSLQNAAYHLA
jgi:hypothetical protein